MLIAIFVACVVSEIALFLLDWHVNYGRLLDYGPIRRLLNTTREDGLASWFGVTHAADRARSAAILSERVASGAYPTRLADALIRMG